MNNLQGKTAFITGATSGIGEAIAKDLAKYGVNLILTARRKDKLKELKKELLKKNDIKINIFSLDVRDKDDVLKKVSHSTIKQNIDILINNAGLALDASKIDECDIDDWETMIDTNIKGLLYVSRVLIPHMRENNSGHIINLGSIAGEQTYPNGNVYCATKAAVHTLSEAMNIDLVDTAIKVSTIAPGAVETEFSNVRFKGDKDKAKSVYEGFTPLKAKDISDLVVYILNTPSHVNIQHTLIMPTAQRNPYLINRQ